ncbi:transcriptional activator NhaR [Oxalobacter formigenes]|uniref:transcriptional activator NhaR n=1 Tax=Oxalobacter formigenes TaxID=847 RepID=UPI0022AFF212|nr:transcriptional activator NhaR [Oxalobacter formigenes]WAW05260.1 transcriptional activator NhaR [Oxalobacter formigenes]
MSALNLNYRHLYYFWVVAKEGGVTRAAERLGVAVQTISMQLSLLEKAVGKTLFAPQGRRLVLTEAGRLALNYADQIFLLGEQLQEALAEDDIGKSMRLTVGISDSLPKMIAYRLLETALEMPQFVRMECYDGSFETLLADLALHKLDVVLTDRPINMGSSLRVFSHELGDCPVWLFGSEELAEKYGPNFPECLTGAPILLPTRGNAIRTRLDQWFEVHGIRPFIVGEFSDSALLKTFGRNGLGMFHAPIALEKEMKDQFRSVPIGELTEVREQYYAISAEMKIKHAAVEAILAAHKGKIF